MKPINLCVTILILTCVFSCKTNKQNPHVVAIKIVDAKVNYFEYDSIQSTVGYYPLKMYLLLMAYNMSCDTVSLPIETLINSKSSSITISHNYLNTKSHCETVASGVEYIAPNDSISLVMVVNFIDKISSQNYSCLNNLLNEITLSNNLINDDSIACSKPLPDTVIIIPNTKLTLKFRGVNSINEDVNWI